MWYKDCEYDKYYEDDEDNLTVTILLDDDTEIECSIEAVFPVQDVDYVALSEIGSRTEEVFLYRFKQDYDNGISLENIDDDEEFEMVADAYDALMCCENTDVFFDEDFE